MSVRRVTAGYLVAMGVLVGCFFAVPSLRLPATAAVGFVSVAATVYGVRVHRPQRAYAWWLLAGGIFVFAVGDALYLIATGPLIGSASAESGTGSDVFYLLMFPLLGAGLLGLTRANSGARDRSGLLDFLVFSTAALLLLWISLLHPFVVTPGPMTYERSVLSAYALAGALVLAATARLLVTARNPAALLLVVGAVGMLGGDVAYGAAVLDGSWRSGGPEELGWFAFYVAWGAAALHPSMAALTERADPPQTEVGRTRLILLGLAAVFAPAILLVEALTGEVREGAIIAVASGVSFVLVLHRLSDAADAHRFAVARERTLRLAGAALVSARDAADVELAVRGAVGRLLPAHPHRLVLSVNRSDGIPAAATSIWGPAVAAGSAYYPPPSVATARRSRLLRVRTLQPALVGQLGGFETAVLCPLVLDERATGVPRVGAMLVAADPKVFPTLCDSLEVLASQVALALERISLNQEINRRESEEYFRSLVQHTADVILIVDETQRVRYASPSVTAVLGVEAQDCEDLGSFVHPEDQANLLALLTRAEAVPDGPGPGGAGPDGAGRDGVRLRQPGEWTDWTARRLDGELAQLEVSCRDLRRDRAVRGFVLTMRDVTERRRLERELSHRAVHDTLTGLANRASYQDRVHAAVCRARSTGHTVGTFSIDLDEFTAINDSHGQAVGDGVLIAAGARLGELIGDAGVVARLGGDEFAVLVPEAEDPAQVERIADRLVEAFAEPLVVNGSLIGGSVSIGVATTADASDAGDLLQRADLALYVAKRAGKGRWCRYQAELHTAIIERLELRTALAEAVGKLSFTVEYQPIVDLGSGAAVGFEALVRWNHPARGPIPPEQFIALAEETGLIEPIGDWVLREAVSAAGRWHAESSNGRSPYVSVNVSARQLRTPGFVAKVRETLASAGMPPDRLMLEITESLLLREEEPVWSELSGLRAVGLRVAIDDFGTGFSSLSYLQQMPADVLKMDRSFTEKVASSRRQRLLVEGIVRLAETLGLDVVAEGVETEAVQTVLMDMGCRLAQGYLFSRPVREVELTRWFDKTPEVPAPRRTPGGEEKLVINSTRF